MENSQLKTIRLRDFFWRASLLKPSSRVLVAGCGSGYEALELSFGLENAVSGIDLKADFAPSLRSNPRLTLTQADLRDIPYKAFSFDFVYCYHVLEHIPDYRKVISELERVLKPRGTLFIGTPNSQRLLAYLNNQRGATLLTRIRWNCSDWQARLKGRFSNEAGAHAGFSFYRLNQILSSYFPVVKDFTLDYYKLIYPRWAKFFKILKSCNWHRILFPSVYFICHKEAA